MNLKKLIFPLIIIIVTITTTIITMHMYHTEKTEEEASGQHSPKDFMNYIFQELNLNAEQAELFSTVTGEFHQNGKILSNQLRVKKIDFLNELSNPESDSIYLVKLVKDIGQIEYNISHLTLEHYFNSEKILTDEQLASLKRIYKEMLPDSIE